MTRNVWGSDLPVEETKGGTGKSAYVIGDILYASSANTLSKLEIGDEDDVLTVVSGVPAWVAAGLGSGEFNLVEKTFTATQLKAINTSPPELLAAQGADTAIVPLFSMWQLNAGSEVLVGSAQVYGTYSGSTLRITSSTSTNFIDKAADRIAAGIAEFNAASGVETSEANNTAVDLYASADFTGNASDDATLDVWMWYTVEAL